MAVYHYKNGGTRASGASSAGDWTDANCYPVTSNVPFNDVNNGDTIFFDNDTFTITASLKNASNVNTGAAYTITSRDGAGATLLAGDTNAKRIFQITHATTVHTVTISDLTLSLAAQFTTTNPAGLILLLSGASSTVNFSDCTITGFDFNVASGTQPALVDLLVAGAVSFTDCTFDTVTFTSAGAMFGLIGNFTTSGTLTLTRTTFAGGTITAAGNVEGTVVNSIGAVVLNDFTAHDFTISTPTGTVTGAIVQSDDDAGSSLTVNTATLYNNTLTCQTYTAGAGMVAYRTYAIDRLTVYNSTATATATSVGGAFVAYGANATGTYDDCHVYGVTSYDGPAFYMSQGSTGNTIHRLYAHDNVASDAGGGAVYLGGWGDVTLSDSSIVNNDSAAATGGGGGIHHLINRTTNPVGTFTHTITGCTIAGNTSSGNATDGAGISADLGDAAGVADLVINYTNCIIRNDDTYDIVITDNSATAGSVAMTLTNCNLQSSAAQQDGTQTATVTVASAVTGDPQFHNLNGDDARIYSSSIAYKAGKFLSFSSKDRRGKWRRVPPSIGAYEPGSGGL